MKSVGILIAVGAGVFVGAVAMEIIHRVRPNTTREIEESTKRTLSDIGTAFKKGYRGELTQENSS